MGEILAAVLSIVDVVFDRCRNTLGIGLDHGGVALRLQDLNA